MRTVRSELFEERRHTKMFADAWRDIGIAYALLKGGESTCQMMCLLQWGRSKRMGNQDGAASLRAARMADKLR